MMPDGEALKAGARRISGKSAKQQYGTDEGGGLAEGAD